MANYLYLYIIPFCVAVALAYFLSPLIARLSRRWGLVTKPKPGQEGGRKSKRRVPYVGGIVVILSFIILVGYYSAFTNQLLGGILSSKHVLGLLVAGLVILVGGILDDKYNLPAKWQFIPGLIAVLIIIASGIGIEYINNPFNGDWSLQNWSFTFFEAGGVPYRLILWADLFTLLWISGMDYSLQWIDGIDGLAVGIGVIGFIVTFFLSASAEVMQPEVAFLSIVMAGALLGFLPYAWPPSKMLGGQAGSQFWGFMLGVLAIISGAKIATALLVMGIPIFDTARVIIMRLWRGKNPFKGDKNHIHHWLMQAGFSEKQTILFLYGVSAIFGVTALLLQGFQKLLALIALVIIGLIMAIFLWMKVRGKRLEEIEEL